MKRKLPGLSTWIVWAIVGLCAPVPSASAQVVDPSSLTNKLVAGYQGWFGAPGDGSSTSWDHWSKSGSDIGPGLYNVDLWPDLSEYDAEELFPAPHVTLLDGSTGQLFSSRTLKTTERHFKWMKEHGIDGAMLQRFIPAFGGSDFHARNRVLQNIGSAATTHGRVFMLEYDISGQSDGTVVTNIVQDWKYLIDVYHITQHARYQHHAGKPVVAIWGLGFGDRGGTPADATQIIDFFKNDPVYGGNYLIGGVPEGWRTLTGSSKTDPAWANIYRSWNVISPWTVGRYSPSTSSINSYRNNFVVPDLSTCNSLSIGYLQVVWPGFSWDNLMELPPGTSNIPRNGGQFFWDQVNAFQSAGVNMVKVAMFDEEDEGTAILKISQNHPTTDNWVDYGTLPHDWYMRLAGVAARMLRGQMIPANSTLSVPLPLDPACIGDEASFNLGEDVGDRMNLVTVADGNTTVVTKCNLSCRKNISTTTDLYMYFNVADTFAFQGSVPDLCVAVDYYEGNCAGTSTTGCTCTSCSCTSSYSLRLQYDSIAGGAYKDAATIPLSSNSNKWKRKVYHLTDAYFGNRENNGADFRIAFIRLTSGNFYIDRVTVTVSTPKPPVIQLNKTSFSHTIAKDMPVANDSFTGINMGNAALNYTASTNAGWLSVSPSTGRSTGETDSFTVQYNTAALPSGLHTATISVADATASNSPQNIAVNLDVVAFGDFDNDGDVDQEDFGKFQACFSGSGVPYGPGCLSADSNADNFVDSQDLNEFFICLNGPNKPPGC